MLPLHRLCYLGCCGRVRCRLPRPLVWNSARRRRLYFLPTGYLARVVRWWIELFVGLALAGFAHSIAEGVSFTAAPQKAKRPSALLNASSGLLANFGRIGVLEQNGLFGVGDRSPVAADARSVRFLLQPSATAATGEQS